MYDEESREAVARVLAADRDLSCMGPPTTFRLHPLRAASLRGSRGTETDHFLNHSWALPRKERHAESWGTAMRKVSLFPSYAMIYDTTLVTDLIITVYFSLRREEKWSQQFQPLFLSFLVFSFTNGFFPPISSLLNSFSFFVFSLPTLPSYSSHKYPFKFTNTIKNSPHQRLHYALTSIWWEGESLDTANML